MPNLNDVEIHVSTSADNKGIDKATSGLEKLQGAVGRSVDASKNFSKVFLGVTAAVGAGAIAFGASARKAYNEAEAAQKQLEHAVLNVSKATKEQLNQTSKLADELERKGVLDGDNIKLGLAQLSTFGLSNKAVQGLGGSLADLAVNQFGVNASGEQLSQTANMMAKALNGQFGVLEKSGIRFTEAQQAIIKTGTEMEKVKAINEGFAQNLKLTNDIARQTAEGFDAHLKVQIGNVQEAMGEIISKAIGPIIIKFSEWIDRMGGAEGIMDKLATKIREVSTWMKEHQLIVMMVAGAIAGPLVVAFTAWAIAAGAAAVSTLIALAPVIAIGAAIGGLIYGIRKLIEHWDRIKASFRDGGWMDRMIDRFWMLTGPIGMVVKGIKEIIQNWDKIKNFALNVGGKIGNLFGGARAMGGPVSAGSAYLVGERGPELFMPGTSGNIIPNNKLGGGTSGGQTISVNFYGDLNLDSESRLNDLAKTISEKIGRLSQQAVNGAY